MSRLATQEAVMVIDPDASLRFLRAAYEPNDWIAIFLKSYEHGPTMQRVGPLALFVQPRVQAWLRAMNAQRYNCYVGVNAITPGFRARTKRAIGHVRHVFIDIDEDATQFLAMLANRRDLPPPSCVIESSPNRVHVLWRVSGFTTDAVEQLQKHLARDLRTDTAATSCAQTTRLPGYRNHKRHPSTLVTIQYGSSDQRYGPDAFPTPPHTYEPPPVSLRLARPASVGRLERARRYLARVPPAIAGQRGDVHTFQVCCRIARGFALDESEAFAVLAEWNDRCLPPWSHRELFAKIAHARRYGREGIGCMLRSPERTVGAE